MEQTEIDEEWEIFTRSPEETMRLGEVLGALLFPGDMVALIGDLGAGKTTLAKGLAKGLGVVDTGEVTSPSFVLVNEYEGRIPIYHVDLYRLQGASEVEDLGWEEIIFGEGVSLVEWAEKAPEFLPEERLEVRLYWVSAAERRFAIAGKGKRSGTTVNALKYKWMKEA